MSFNTAIGLGSALTQLPAGIIQGEEIQRRRSREDEMAAQARAEFQNRQEMFGRTKKGWSMDDAVNAALARYEASGKTPEAEQALYDELNASGAGRDAMNTRGVLQGQAQSAGMYGMQKAGFEQNLRTTQKAEADQDIVRSFMTGKYGALKSHAQKAEDEAAQREGRTPEQVVETGVARTPSGDVRRRNGMTLVYRKVRGADGQERTDEFDVGQAGAFLNSPGLMNLAAQERAGFQMDRQFNASLGEARKGNEIALQKLHHDERVARAKFHDDELRGVEKKIEIYTTQKAKAMTDPSSANLDLGGIDKELTRLNTQADAIKQKANAAYHGFDFDEKRDAEGNLIGIDYKRSIVPAGSKDPALKIDWRPADKALYANADNLVRLVSMTNPRADGEDDQAYTARLKGVAKRDGLTSGWNALMVSPDGAKSVVVPAGAWSDGEKPAAYNRLYENGWRPVNPPGFNYGTDYNTPDAQGAAAVAERASDSSRSARVGGRSGVMPRGVRGGGSATRPVMVRAPGRQ